MRKKSYGILCCIVCLCFFSDIIYAQQNTAFDIVLKKRMSKRNIELLPKWTSVLAKVQNGFRLKNASRISKYSWGDIRKRWNKLPAKEKLIKVNALFNAFPYTEDINIYRMQDYWAAPKEFLANSGDCEDYAIIKFYALLDLGIPEKDMRILVLIDTIRGIGHAVLLVNLKGETYLLDNVSELVLPLKLYTHYSPQFLVDRNGVYL